MQCEICLNVSGNIGWIDNYADAKIVIKSAIRCLNIKDGVD